MDVLHPQKPPQSPLSMLNPDAPIFVPMKSYQTVEDFSDQWWDLVHSNPYFRDYWLQDCFEDVDDVFDDDFFANEDDFFLPDFDAFSNIFIQKEEEKMKEEEEKKKKKKEESAKAELITMAALKWNGCNGRVMEASRNFEKMKEEEEKKKKKKEESAKAELITIAALKWNGCNGRVMEASRNFEKIPKVVKSVKVSPRTIHQPR